MSDRLDALTVRETNGKSYWTKIGVAWPNKNGPGYIVRLDAMPASNEGQFTIHLREPRERPGDGGPRSEARQSAPPSSGNRYRDDESIPF